MPLYQVSRWTEEWQIVEADSKSEAIEIAIDSSEWDRDGYATKGDDLYCGHRVIELED